MTTLTDGGDGEYGYGIMFPSCYCGSGPPLRFNYLFVAPGRIFLPGCIPTPISPGIAL
jgi:hypothetical protein